MSEPIPEPPLVDTVSVRVPAVTRVTLGLVFFGLADLVQSIVSIIAAFKVFSQNGGTINLSAPLGCIGYWLAAWLVWNNKRIIWPILAYLAAIGSGFIAGPCLVLMFSVPLKLVRALVASYPGWFGFYLTYSVCTLVFFTWILIESCRAEWPSSFPAPRNSWFRPRIFVTYAATAGALLAFGILTLLNGAWTEPVLARARKQLGNNYDYRVMNYYFRSVNGHTTYHAVVLAYNNTELNQVILNWKD